MYLFKKVRSQWCKRNVTYCWHLAKNKALFFSEKVPRSHTVESSIFHSVIFFMSASLLCFLSGSPETLIRFTLLQGEKGREELELCWKQGAMMWHIIATLDTGRLTGPNDVPHHCSPKVVQAQCYLLKDLLLRNQESGKDQQVVGLHLLFFNPVTKLQLQVCRHYVKVGNHTVRFQVR